MVCSAKPLVSNAVLRRQSSHMLSLTAALLMSGCGSTPEEPSIVAAPAEAELTLNLPEPSTQSCDCEAVAAAAETYFDRGVRALAVRDYVQALRYFERHRDDGGAEQQREAEVGIAFVTLMTEMVGADDDNTPSAVDERAELMVLSLAAVATLEGRIAAVDALNQALSKDLEKREEALKRLRDLTLGQPES